AETIRQRYIPNLTTGVLDPASGDVAGTLFVQPRVGAGEEGTLLDDLVEPHFLLVTAGAAAQAWLTEVSLGVWHRLGGERVVVAREAAGDSGDIRAFAERGTLFADWMAQHRAAAVVVRPDRYVYGIARDADALNR